MADALGDALDDTTVSPVTTDALSAALSDEEHIPENIATSNVAKKNAPGYLEDIVKSAPGALARGVGATPQMFAYGGNFLTQLAGQGVGAAHDLFAEHPYSAETHKKLANAQPFYTGTTVADALTKAGAGATEGLMNNLSPEQHQKLQELQENGLVDNKIYNPQTLPGQLTSGAISGAMSGNAAAGMTTRAIGGAGATLAAHEYPDNPLATAVGGLAGPVAGKIGSGIKGQPINPDVAELARHLEDEYGIKIPPYQMSNSPLVQRAGSLLDRLGFTKDNDNIGKFNSAIATSIGAPGENALTPEVMKAARKNNGAGYDAVLNRIGDIDVSNIDTELAAIKDRAKLSLSAEKREPLNNLIDSIIDNVEKGDVIPAKIFKSMTSSNSPLEDAIKNRDITTFARQIENVLHNTLKKSAAPEDVATLNALDTKWKNMRTVQGLAAKTDASGQISPAALLTPVAKSFKDMAYSGAGDLGTLATAGKTFKLTPSSGTYENSLMGKALGYIPHAILPEALTGGTALYHGSSVPEAAALALGTYGAGKLAGSALSSDWYRNYLIDRAATPNHLPANGLMNYAIPAALSSAPLHK